MLKSNLIDRVGTIRVKPNWRYETLLKPAANKLRSYTTVPTTGSNCLRRYISAGLPFEVNYKIPDDVNKYIQQLDARQALKLKQLWERAFKRKKLKKVVVDYVPTVFKNNAVWNMRKIDGLNDPFLVRAAKHVGNYVYDESIAYAIELIHSADHDEIVRFMGYCFYAKVPDKDIAKRWNIPVRHVTALRLLQFDFSYYPKDRMANFTYLRQLANSGAISDVDFAYYKRVYELGELGLKAQTDFFSLTDEEKGRVEEYLGKSVISNTLNVNFSIRNQKDALTYGAVMSNLTGYYIKRAEVTYFAAKTRNLDAATRRIEGDLDGKISGINNTDEELLAVLREHSLQDPVMQHKTLANLK